MLAVVTSFVLHIPAMSLNNNYGVTKGRPYLRNSSTMAHDTQNSTVKRTERTFEGELQRKGGAVMFNNKTAGGLNLY